MERLEFEAAVLMARHPPLWRHGNKKVVYDMACPQGCAHAGDARVQPLGGDAPPLTPPSRRGRGKREGSSKRSWRASPESPRGAWSGSHPWASSGESATATERDHRGRIHTEPRALEAQ